MFKRLFNRAAPAHTYLPMVDDAEVPTPAPPPPPPSAPAPPSAPVPAPVPVPVPPASEPPNGATVTRYDNLFLDFTKEDISSLEKKMEIFGGNNLLQMIVGMGDYIRPFKGDDMPNTKAYPNYDIYVIYTGYNLAAPELKIQENLDAIVDSDNPNRVICNIDLENKTQVNLFTDVFNHKINTIIFGDSKVALLPQDSVELLNYDGEGRVDVPLSLIYFPPGQRGIEYNTIYASSSSPTKSGGIQRTFIRNPNRVSFTLRK